MIRGKGSNPRISNDNRPHDPGGGGVARNIPLSSKVTRNDISWKLNMNRYGKPVLSPNYQTDIPILGRSVDKKLLDKLVPEAHASRDVTRLNPGGRDWIDQPRPPPARGVGFTDTGQTRQTQRKYVAAGAAAVTNTNTNTIQIGYNTRNTELVNNDWHEVMRKHRNKKSIRNLDYREIVSKMDNFEPPRTDRTVVTDQCKSPVEDIRPDGGPTEGLAKGEVQSLEPMEGGDRCVKCHKRKKRYRTGRSSGHVRKPLSARLRPWSGRSPQMLNDSVPHVTQRIPPVIIEPMQYEWIGRKSDTSADLSVPQNYLEIPNQILPNAFLQLAKEARELVVIKESSGFMENVRSGSSQWSGPPLAEVLTTGDCGTFGRESVDLAVIPGRLSEERPIVSADSGDLLDNISGYRKDTAGRSEGQEGCFGKPTIASRQYDSPSEEHGIVQPVTTERRVYTSAGPLGFRVTITDWSEPVEPPDTMKQVIIPRPTADREGCSSAANVHTAVTMFSAQPVAAGLSDPIAVHHPVDVHDKDDLEVSGPVGRDSHSEFRQTDVIGILNDNRCDDDMASRSRTTEHPDDCSGDIKCVETTYDGSLVGELDPLVKKDNGCQLVRVNGGLNNCLTNVRDVSGSSDSGVHSWTEQWENMSDVSLNDSYDNPGNILRGIPGEMSQLLFGAPPNTEVESDSDCPVTDSSLSDIVNRCPSELMSGEEGFKTGRKYKFPNLPDDSDSDTAVLSDGFKTDGKLKFPNCVEDSDSDIAVLSDFSDDSSIFGIRKVLRRRVPYRGRAPPSKKDCAPAPRTPPVKAKNRAEQWQYERNSTRANWTRWQYGTPLDCTCPDFVQDVRYFTNVCLNVNKDPRLDRYYPRLVRSLARAARVVRTVPRCRVNHRRRRDLMMRLFDEDMEQTDVVRDRFPDRHVYKFTDKPHNKPESTAVTGTRTPPIYRNHHRKYAALRDSETDVDDYFGSAEEEWRWTARSVSWYQPCI